VAAEPATVLVAPCLSLSLSLSSRQEPPEDGVLTSDRARREAIQGRAAEIARSPEAGSDFDNSLRAIVDVAIAQRAAEIARSPEAGGDFDNWLRAERELRITYRAQEIALATHRRRHGQLVPGRARDRR
jgi:hypothetical protein